MSEEHLTPADNVPGCTLGGAALMKGQSGMRSALTLKRNGEGGGLLQLWLASTHILMYIGL